MENYGLAIDDASTAIKMNPSFVKAYYRKGTAYLMMGKFDEAKDSFVMANKLTGSKDKDIVDKLQQIKRAIYEREFAKSISR
jgi:serine/threonine-protein phosphatase 5